MPRCFKCEREMTSAVHLEDGLDRTWENPLCGLVMEGGSSFGCSLYDTLLDGVYIEVIICDLCLQKAQGTDRLREINDPGRKGMGAPYTPHPLKKSTDVVSIYRCELCSNHRLVEEGQFNQYTHCLFCDSQQLIPVPEAQKISREVAQKLLP